VPEAHFPAVPPGAETWRGRLSLRAKGVLGLLLMAAYVGAAAFLITGERQDLLEMVHSLERVHRQEEQMVQMNLLVARAIMTANEGYYEVAQGGLSRQLLFDLTPLAKLIGPGGAPVFQSLRPYFDRLHRVTEEISANPTRGAIAELRSELHGLVVQMDQLARSLRRDKELLMNGYRKTHDKVTLETLSFVFIGIVIFGAVVTLFFSRLTWDIRRASVRAMAVVKGYRGRPLDISRSDEVGGLMDAINHMQSELRARETQLEVARQQQFHQEKMAAVGSLASAVAHEINNPIMAISGMAQVIVDHCRSEAGKCALSCDLDCHPELILEHAKRIALITRQISEFSAPRSPEPQWIDVNGIVRNTCNLIRFDKRLQRLELTLNLDPQLPAAFAVGDHLAQVLINLLINAADAVEPLTERRPEIIVSTCASDRHVAITVADNGLGMSAEVLAKAPTEFFTTKPRGKGSGLGLYLCQTLAEQNRGALDLSSIPGEGSRITLTLPLAEPEQESL
jgi:signal transduction histidine kinase